MCYKSSCYRFINGSATRDNANTTCKNNGRKLIKIPGDSKSKFIQKYVMPNPKIPMWIGEYAARLVGWLFGWLIGMIVWLVDVMGWVGLGWFVVLCCMHIGWLVWVFMIGIVDWIVGCSILVV